MTPAGRSRRWRKKYVQDDKATIVIVGDRKVIDEQVKAFGPVK